SLALQDLHSLPTRRSSDLWYLVSKIDMNQGWVGNFCTDRPMNEAIIKHHDMLTDHHANIEFFSIEESPKPNIASETGFSFNDERSEEHTSELQSRFDLVCR